MNTATHSIKCKRHNNLSSLQYGPTEFISIGKEHWVITIYIYIYMDYMCRHVSIHLSRHVHAVRLHLQGMVVLKIECFGKGDLEMPA